MIKCGCGELAKYLVYEDKQPHCEQCHDDAISTDIQVLVRKIQGGESLEAIARSYNVSGRAEGVPEASDETRQS